MGSLAQARLPTGERNAGVDAQTKTEIGGEDAAVALGMQHQGELVVSKRERGDEKGPSRRNKTYNNSETLHKGTEVSKNWVPRNINGL